MTSPGESVLHTIRLRGAWVAAPDGDRTRHTRRFGWPTALDPCERVWLRCPALFATDTVVLNGSTLGTAAGVGGVAADVTGRLLPRNELRITTQAGAQPGDVWLEVRRADSGGG